MSYIMCSQRSQHSQQLQLLLSSPTQRMCQTKGILFLKKFFAETKPFSEDIIRRQLLYYLMGIFQNSYFLYRIIALERKALINDKLNWI